MKPQLWRIVPFVIATGLLGPFQLFALNTLHENRSSRARGARKRQASKRLAVLAALVGTALAVAGVAAAVEEVPLRLVGISAEDGPDHLAVLIEATEPAAYTTDQPDPLTVVVELRDVSAKGAVNRVAATLHPPIRDVRIEDATAPDGSALARVHVRLTAPVSYRVRSARSTIHLEFAPIPSPASSPLGAGCRVLGAACEHPEPRTPHPAPYGGVATASPLLVARARGGNATATVLDLIAVEPGDDVLVVTLSGNGPLAASSIHEAEEWPPRVVVDLPNLAARVPEVVPVNIGPLRQIRVAAHSRSPLMTRVVLDMRRAASYRVERPEEPAGAIRLVFPLAEGQPTESATLSSGAFLPRPSPPGAECRVQGAGCEHPEPHTPNPAARDDGGKSPAAAPVVVSGPGRAALRPAQGMLSPPKHDVPNVILDPFAALRLASGEPTLSEQAAQTLVGDLPRSGSAEASATPPPVTPLLSDHRADAADIGASDPGAVAAASETLEPERGRLEPAAETAALVPPAPTAELVPTAAVVPALIAEAVRIEPVPSAAEPTVTIPPAVPPPVAEPVRVAQAVRVENVPTVPPSSAAPRAATPPTAKILPLQRAANTRPTSVPMAQAQAQAGQLQQPLGTRRQYTGHPITMDFQNADLRSVLRTFAEISGLNIVIDPQVQGTVDVALTEVPWDQALDIILRSNRLDYVVDGTVVRIAPLTALEAEEGERRKLGEAQALAGELVVMTRTLSYARAASLQDLITRSVLSSRGQVHIDERTNTLIITDLQQRLTTAQELIDTLDRPEPQVEIEARIVQANQDAAKQIGIQWGILGRAAQELGNTLPLAFPNRAGISGRLGSQGSSQATSGDNRALPTENSGTVVNLPAPSPNSAVGLTLGAINGSLNLDIILSAMEDQGQARILSNPRVTTQNNVQATIIQGDQIPIQTVANNTVTVQFKDAALRLAVTPQITAAGTVIMQVELENDFADFGRSVNGIPPIVTQRAITTVQVADGDTTVIGGIFESFQSSAFARTPGLHRIPLLGWLFRNREQDQRTDELLIFLTPRIVR